MTERPGKKPKAESAAGFSVPSDKHTDRNEDAYFADGETRAIGAFDGIGGAAGSAAASRIAAQVTRELLGNLPAELPREIGKQAVREILIASDTAITNQAKGDIGTTTAIVKIFEEESMPYAVVAHVADSRAYLMRDGNLLPLTLDNPPDENDYPDESERLAFETKAWEMQELLSNVTDLSDADASVKAGFRFRNIIDSCLGPYTDTTIIGVTDVDVQKGDKLVVTTDGVHDNLTTDEIADIIRGHESMTTIAQALVRAAHARSRDRNHSRAKYDDITAAAMIV